mmetsp:Transcript_25472/g.64770  ORF Transcript_25472/g.64770 Transcript_25472/m.64770 type:complete len:215 (-) Transcript_25472:53-697(-)
MRCLSCVSAVMAPPAAAPRDSVSSSSACITVSSRYGSPVSDSVAPSSASMSGLGRFGKPSMESQERPALSGRSASMTASAGDIVQPPSVRAAGDIVQPASVRLSTVLSSALSGEALASGFCATACVSLSVEPMWWITSACARKCVAEGRFSGSFSKACCTTPRTSWPHRVGKGGGGSLTIFMTIAARLLQVNGCFSATSSYSTTPMDQMSILLP